MQLSGSAHWANLNKTKLRYSTEPSVWVCVWFWLDNGTNIKLIMAKMPQDPSGLGYAYHLPSGGILLRIRNTLSQFSDLFSEFNKFITPAPYHDRCERSVHMRLYSLSKREFIGAILAFFVCEFLSIFIGLAGKYPIWMANRQFLHFFLFENFDFVRRPTNYNHNNDQRKSANCEHIKCKR